MRSSKVVITGIMIFLILMGISIISVQAKEDADKPADGKKFVVLQLPLKIYGDYKPITDDLVQQNLEKCVEQNMPRVDVIVPQPDDSKLKGLKISGDPDLLDIPGLVKAYGADYLVMGRMKFTSSNKVAQAGPNSPTYQNNITVEGRADIKIFDGKSGELIVDQKMIQSNNGNCRSVEGSKRYKKLEADLALDCVKDLAKNLVIALKKQVKPTEK